MARIFSGIQPSGELHIGNYLGAVKNWVTLQHTAESIFCIVDYHAIITAYEPDQLRVRRREMAMGLLAAGIDPAVATLFVQSDVPEHTELAWIFNTVTPLGELERLQVGRTRCGLLGHGAIPSLRECHESSVGSSPRASCTSATTSGR